MAKQGLFGGGKPIDLNDGFKTSEEIDKELQAEPEVQETPPEPEVVEPAVEPKAEETPTEPTEEPKEEPKQEEPKAEESPSSQFDFAFFNKELNKNYESLDQIKADLNKPTMESEYGEAQKKLEELESKYNDLNRSYEVLADQYEQNANLVSDDARRVDMYMRANPDKDASIVQRIFSTGDLSSIADIDMVKMGRRFNTKRLKGTDKDLEATIAEELGQDPDTPVSEWPVTAQNRLAVLAADFENQFKSIRSGVQLPERVNIEALKEQRKQADADRLNSLTEGWNKIADESLQGTKSLKIPIGTPKEGEEQQFFEWELSGAPKAEADAIRDNFIKMGMNPDGATFQQALNIALFQKNQPQIMLKYREDLLARSEEKHLDEVHNTQPLKDTERTDLTTADKEKAEQTQFAREPLIRTFRGSPLFTKK